MKSSLSINLTKLALKIEINKFAKQHGVRYVMFGKTAKKVKGTYSCSPQIIYLDERLPKKDLLNTFFHEMGHHYAVRQKKWLNYHLDLNKNLTPSQIFDIENKVDKIGNKLWNKYINSKICGKYKYVYPKKNKQQMMTINK